MSHMLHEEEWKQVRVPKSWWKILKQKALEEETTMGKLITEALANTYDDHEREG